MDRTRYWLVWLANISVIASGLAVLAVASKLKLLPEGEPDWRAGTVVLILLGTVIACLFSLAASGVKRLRDMAQSPYWMLLCIVTQLWPLIAPIFIGWGKSKAVKEEDAFEEANYPAMSLRQVTVGTLIAVTTFLGLAFAYYLM